MRMQEQEARIIIPIKEIDDQFMQIQNLIHSKKQLLFEKQKKLKSISKQNKFLEIVKDDYMKYYDYINQQKRDQIKALQVLNEYIEDLTYTGKLTTNNIEDAKVEQSKILHEMNSIKKSLDQVVDKTKYVQNKLNDKNKIKE